MKREEIKNLIELVPESEMDALYQFVTKTIPEVQLEADEVEAMEEGMRDIEEHGGISHSDVWNLQA